MRLPENPSVLAQIKVFMQKLPLGTALTLYDLMRYFPNQTESSLSASLSTLRNLGYLITEEEKVWSVYKTKTGKQHAGHLTSYVLTVYPDLSDLRKKPEQKARVAKPELSVRAPVVLKKDIPVKEGEKFDRVFAMNPNIKFDTEALEDLAETLIFCTDFPVHDHISGEKARSRYELLIPQRLKDFNPLRDVIAIYGDSIVLAMTVFYLASKQIKSFNIARYSNRDNMYHVREIAISNFV